MLSKLKNFLDKFQYHHKIEDVMRILAEEVELMHADGWTAGHT
jgi:hypothetical protein